jgi:predicted esterase
MHLLHTVYEPAGEGPHPTILALHGWGANAMDLLGLAPYLAGGRFLVLCPQGSIEVPLGPMTGYGWFPISMGGPPEPAAFAAGVGDARRFLASTGSFVARPYDYRPRGISLLDMELGSPLQTSSR